MKTKIYKPIAIVAISILSFNISAQYTKRISYNKNQDKYLLARFESPNIMSSAREELSLQLLKLEEVCKFNPNIDGLYYDETVSEDNLSTITVELEGLVKFHPEESYISPKNEIMIEEVTAELEKELKFDPSESLVDPKNENLAIISDILTELERDVKYQPTIIE